jgi:hypothetical protein
VALVDFDEILGRNGNVLGTSAVGTKPGPLAVRTDLRVAFMAVAAGFVAPSSDNDDLIAFL